MKTSVATFSTVDSFPGSGRREHHKLTQIEKLDQHQFAYKQYFHRSRSISQRGERVDVLRACRAPSSLRKSASLAPAMFGIWDSSAALCTKPHPIRSLAIPIQSSKS